jgi:hypothetical protein
MSGRNPGWTIGVGDDGRVEWNAGDGTNRCDYDGPAGMMNDGQWHHVAFSMLRGTDGLVTLFFDGKILDQEACVLNSVSSGNFTECQHSFPLVIFGIYCSYSLLHDNR